MQLNKLIILLITITFSINNYSQVGPRDYYFDGKIKIIDKCRKEIKFKTKDSLNFFSKKNNLKLSFHQIWMNCCYKDYYSIKKMKLNNKKVFWATTNTTSLELNEKNNFNFSSVKFQIEQSIKGNSTSLILVELIKGTEKMILFLDFTNDISDTKIEFPIIFKKGIYKVYNDKKLELKEVNQTEYNNYMNIK